MNRAVLVLVLVGCATTQTRADSMRDGINKRHAACQERVKAIHPREEDSMALFFCDQDEDRECREAHLEARCGEWQWP